MVDFNKSDIQLFLTNSNEHRNTDEVFHFFCQNILEKKKPCTSKETDGEILYVGILMKQRVKSKRKKDIETWIQHCGKYKINVDILYINEKKVEVSTLPNKYHLLQEGCQQKRRKQIYSKAVLRVDKEMEFSDALEKREKGAITNKNGKNQDGTDFENNENKRDTNINKDKDYDYDSKIKLKTVEIDNIPQECFSQVEGILFLIEFPLTVSQNYLNKQLTLRVQLREAYTQIQTKKNSSFFNENYKNYLNEFFESPPLLLNTLHWSSAFTSNALYEKQKKRDKEKMWNKKKKKKKKKNVTFTRKRGGGGDHVREREEQEEKEGIGKNKKYEEHKEGIEKVRNIREGNVESNEKNKINSSSDRTFEEHKVEQKGKSKGKKKGKEKDYEEECEEDDEDEDDDDNYDYDDNDEEDEDLEQEEEEHIMFLNRFDEQSENKTKYGLSCSDNIHHIYNFLNTQSEKTDEKHSKEKNVNIIIEKKIVVVKSLNITYKIIDHHLYVEMENISKNNTIEISELFSKSLIIDTKFPIYLNPEDTYSFFFVVDNFVQLLTFDIAKAKRERKTNKSVTEKNLGVKNEQENQFKRQTDDTVINFKNKTIVEKYKNHDEILTLCFNNDKTIISLCVKWRISNTFNNYIWSQFCIEAEMPRKSVFNLEISLVNEIVYSSFLIVVFSFFNISPNTIDLSLRIEDNHKANSHAPLLAFSSTIDVGIIKPNQCKSTSIKLLASMIGLHNFPFVKVKEKRTNKMYWVDMGSILVTE